MSSNSGYRASPLGHHHSTSIASTSHLNPSSISSSTLHTANPPSTSTSSNNNNAELDTRKRQSKRDEAIRKKIEADLQRKSGKHASSSSSSTAAGHNNNNSSAGPTRRSRKMSKPTAAAGTVSALRPLPALTVPQSMTVADASQLCAAKRTDCVLVVDDEEHLAGIFTAKDLAFRVVAQGLDARNTPVSAIMTRSPMVTRDSTSATEALNTMVTRGFRHLPVCNDEGDVVGLLDIAKVFYEALEKLERAHGSSQKLYNALEGVQSEWGAAATSGPQAAMLQYIENLRVKMSIPDLTTILDSRTLPVTVGVRTTVKDAARMMKEHHTTAVCVMEGGAGSGPGAATATSSGGPVSGKIAGIFTSKDVVLRVIAAGLEPKSCSVVRVMTPHPDTAPPTMTIQEALRKMHDGRYLNLPVVEESDVEQQRLVGVVDVLKLTYATLEMINSMNDDAGGPGGDGASGGGGPMWNRFWNSFGQTGSNGGGSMTGGNGGAGTADDGDSVLSGPTGTGMGTRPTSMYGESGPGTPSKIFGSSADLSSDLHPNDSASAVGGADGLPQHGGGGGARNLFGDDGQSQVGTGAGGFNAPIVDDGTYLFKFVTPSGRTHRFQARYDDGSFETVREIVTNKLGLDPFFEPPAPTGESLAAPLSTEGGGGGAEVETPSSAGAGVTLPDPNDFSLAYTDDDSDVVLITADGDVLDAVSVARKQGRDRVLLILQGGRAWTEAMAKAQAASVLVGAAAAAAAAAASAGAGAGAGGKRGGAAAAAGKARRSKGLGMVEEDLDEDADGGKEEDEVSGNAVPTGTRERGVAAAGAGANGKATGKGKGKGEDEVLFGFLPKELALPAAIGFLGVAVIGAVIVTRASGGGGGGGGGRY
ncbi:unnamed protein product [Tilletia controversa]|nr:unnamed protein product [Tilletia caries]CAD6909721.1 unnamed protein product [Tilletia controversa]CAD6911218.1 unnamed protein product [Tilletia caries]CAD6913439.1 unnamed protein product [Tilletia controversa]CAD6970529.1 unnamed protein product [Tilletia controversa]